MKNIRSYKHIIWDWNGTLLDDMWICMEIINKMLLKRGIPLLNQASYKEVFGFPIKDYYIRAGFDFDKEPFEELANEYITEYDDRCTECDLHNGAIDILKRIHESGISQSILSASNEKSLRNAIKNYGIECYFCDINGLNDNYAKSKVDIGSKWLAEQPFDPHDVLLIGDTEHDFEVAECLGVDCILVSYGHQSVERLRNCKVTVLETILQIEELL